MFDIKGVSNSESATPSSTRDGFADMLKQVRLNGPMANLNSGGTSVPSTDNGSGAGMGAAQPDLLPVALRRAGPGDGTAAQSTGSGASPYLPYVPPIRTQDDQGKTIPKYRMGVGQRVLGTLSNFASGFAGKGGSPVHVGPGALNNRYSQDEAYREQQNQDIAQRNVDQYRNAIDYRTIGQDPITGKWKGKTYGGEVRELEPPPWAAPQTEQPPNNNDAPVGPPEAEPERYMSTPARRRFAEVRRQRRGY